MFTEFMSTPYVDEVMESVRLQAISEHKRFITELKEKIDSMNTLPDTGDFGAGYGRSSIDIKEVLDLEYNRYA